PNGPRSIRICGELGMSSNRSDVVIVIVTGSLTTSVCGAGAGPGAGAAGAAGAWDGQKSSAPPKNWLTVHAARATEPPSGNAEGSLETLLLLTLLPTPLFLLPVDGAGAGAAAGPPVRLRVTVPLVLVDCWSNSSCKEFRSLLSVISVEPNAVLGNNNKFRASSPMILRIRTRDAHLPVTRSPIPLTLPNQPSQFASAALWRHTAK